MGVERLLDFQVFNVLSVGTRNLAEAKESVGETL